jgi:formylglycine-generating enzyme required for sulfatase activity
MTKDPVQTNNESSHRVLRGGSYYNFTGAFASSYRYYFSPGYRNNVLCLRLVRSVKEK